MNDTKHPPGYIPLTIHSLDVSKERPSRRSSNPSNGEQRRSGDGDSYENGRGRGRGGHGGGRGGRRGGGGGYRNRNSRNQGEE